MSAASIMQRLEQAETIQAWLAKTSDDDVRQALWSDVRAMNAVFEWRKNPSRNIAHLRGVGRKTIDQLYLAATGAQRTVEHGVRGGRYDNLVGDVVLSCLCGQPCRGSNWEEAGAALDSHLEVIGGGT